VIDRQRLSPPIPAWARWMLTIAPLGDRRSDAESDVAELFGDRIERYGRVYAHRRLCSDILSLWRGTLLHGKPLDLTWYHPIRPSGRTTLPRQVKWFPGLGGTMLRDLRFGLRLFRKHPGPVGITIG